MISTDAFEIIVVRDGDGLDNRRCNLRVCTRSQNNMNERPRGGTSEFKGVSWDNAISKWRPRIKHNGKQCYLGIFTDEIDAALAYDEAARIYFGPFARANFPQTGEEE